MTGFHEKRSFRKQIYNRLKLAPVKTLQITKFDGHYKEGGRECVDISESVCSCVQVWVRERESGRGTVILKRFFESGHAKYH